MSLDKMDLKLENIIKSRRQLKRTYDEIVLEWQTKRDRTLDIFDGHF